MPFGSELRVAGSIVRRAGLAALSRAKRVSEIIVGAHPAAPHYYLFAVGVRDAAKGKGLGGRLIREGLKRADLDGVAAYLENSNPRNTPLYEQLGFASQRPLPLPGGAPPLVAMLRPALQSSG